MSIAAWIDARVSRPVAFGALIASAAFFAVVMVGVASRGPGFDLVPLVVAGRLVSQGHASHLYAQDPQSYNLVSDAVVRDAARSAGFAAEPTPFVYPPLVAFLMQALSSVSFATVATTWAWLSAGLFLAGLHLVGRTYAPTATFWKRPMTWALLLMALCAFEPVRYGFWLGQTTAIIFPLVAAALLLQRRNRLAPAGIALALATFIKLTPIVFAVVWLWRGPRRAAWWCLGVLAFLWAASIGVMGIASHVAYIARVRAIAGVDVVAYNNQSLLPFLSRLWLDRSAWTAWHMWTAPVLARALNWTALAMGACGIAYLLLIKVRRAEEQRWRPTAEAFACLLLLLAPNIAWTHYFVFLLPVLVVVLSGARGRSAVPVILSATAFALLCRPILAAQDQLPSTDSLLLLSTPTLAALVAAVAVCWVALESVDVQPARSVQYEHVVT